MQWIRAKHYLEAGFADVIWMSHTQGGFFASPICLATRAQYDASSSDWHWTTIANAQLLISLEPVMTTGWGDSLPHASSPTAVWCILFLPMASMICPAGKISAATSCVAIVSISTQQLRQMKSCSHHWCHRPWVVSAWLTQAYSMNCSSCHSARCTAF